MSQENSDRIPTNVVPVHYDLAIKTDVEEGTFEGKAVIQYVLVIIPHGMQLITHVCSLSIKEATNVSTMKP